jgi:hypothetical protein
VSYRHDSDEEQVKGKGEIDYRATLRTDSQTSDTRKRISSVGDAIASGNMDGPATLNPAHTLLIPGDDPLAESPLLSHSPAEIEELTFEDIPWLAFFTTPASLTLFLNHFVYSFIGFMLLTEIPAFLTDALGYDIESAGLLAVTPYAANFVSTMAFAVYFDKKEVYICLCLLLS